MRLYCDVPFIICFSTGSVLPPLFAEVLICFCSTISIDNSSLLFLAFGWARIKAYLCDVLVFLMIEDMPYSPMPLYMYTHVQIKYWQTFSNFPPVACAYTSCVYSNLLA